jgi:hypothetical protein
MLPKELMILLRIITTLKDTEFTEALILLFSIPKSSYTATGTRPIGNGKPIAQFDLVNDISGFSSTTVEGVAYFFGENNGITHTYRDTVVTNGQRYYYAITSFDRGVDSIQIYPSENAIAVSQTLRGGTILPKNVVEVIPNPPNS